MQVQKLSDIDAIISEKPAVVIYFYNDDCAPCMSLRPKVKNLVSDKYPKIELIWINSKSLPEIPASFNVFANPAILVFFDGKENKRFSKYVSIDELDLSIKRYYEMIF